MGREQIYGIYSPKLSMTTITCSLQYNRRSFTETYLREINQPVLLSYIGIQCNSTTDAGRRVIKDNNDDHLTLIAKK